MKKRLALRAFSAKWFVITFCCTYIPAALLAQDVAYVSTAVHKTAVNKTSAKAGTVTLQNFMQRLQQQYGIYFSYQADSLKQIIVASPEDAGGQANADAQLKKALQTSGLTYEKINDVYIIKQATETKSVAARQQLRLNAAYAADLLVKGTVSDSSGLLPGVTINVKGTSKTVTTGADGKYSISVSNPEAVLVFSYVGYTPSEVRVSGRSEINVAMTSAPQQLSSVVVTALGIKRQERSLGYSVAKLDGSAVSNVNAPNVANAMAGKVAGVNIRSVSPDPGASVFITIRGQRSFYGDNQPLIVLDGVPIRNSLNANAGSPFGSGNNQIVDYGNPLSDISPDDIASVSILKGASASALYGGRAANGVILITTKTGSGVKKDLGVSINSSAMFDKAWQFPQFQNTFGSGDWTGTDDVISDASWGPRLDVGTKYVQWDSPLDANGDPIATPWVSYPNRVKDFYETGKTFTNNVSVTGANFRLSYTNLNNTGIVPNTDLKRNNLTLSAGTNLNKAIRLNTNIAYTVNSSKNRPTFNRGSVNNLVYTMPANINVQKLKNYWTPGEEGLKQNSPVPGGNDNPYFIANESLNGYKRNRINGNVQLLIDITKDLSFMARTGVDYYNEDRESRRAFSTHSNPKGAYSLQKLSFSEQNTDFLFTYKKNITSKWFASISAGGNRMDQYTNNSTQATNTLVMPGIYSINNAAAGTTQNLSNTYKAQKRINSLYAMGQVSYNNYVYLDLTARNDWSSTLPQENNSFFYPSASLSAILTDMFKIESNFLSYAKVRANASVAGKDVDPYVLYNTIALSYWGNQVMASNQTSLANNYLKPELSTSYEAGADFRFFNNRLGVDLTWYRTNIKNQVIQIPTTSASGYTSRSINAGEMRNKGVEITLRGTPIQSKNFSWDAGVTYTRNRNKVISLTEGVSQISLGGQEGINFYVKEGSEMGDMYGRTWQTVPDGPHKGEALMNDAGEYETANDYVKIGNYNPDFMLGFTNTFRYKGFTLNALLDWRQGGQFFSYVAKNLLSDGRTTITVPGRDPQTGGLSWTDDQGTARTDGQILHGFVDDGTGKYVPNTKITDPENYYGTYYWDFPSRSTFSATYVKLREVSLDYTFTKKSLHRLPFTSVTFGIIARNLFSYTAAGVGYDPETAMVITNGTFTQGVGGWSLPNTRSFGCKLGINF